VRPVRTRADSLQLVRAIVANFNAEVVASMIGQLFPIVPVAMATLRGIAAAVLDDVASWIDTHCTDGDLRGRIAPLHADAKRIRASGR
jgi:hypothetical protein